MGDRSHCRLPCGPAAPARRSWSAAGRMMVEVSLLGVLAALLAGTISFVSPCVLPLVPGYVSYIAGRTVSGGAARSRANAVWLSFCFVLGFSTIFLILGASATALGPALLPWRYELTPVGGATVFVFGDCTSVVEG